MPNPNMTPEELQQKIKNELFDYAHGQIISGGPVEQHVNVIIQLLTQHNQALLQKIEEAMPVPENYGNGFTDLIHKNDVANILNQAREGKL